MASMQHTVILVGIMVMAVLGPAIVIAVVGFATIKALGRNPSAAPKIFTGVILMLVFAEATSIIALLVVFQLFGQ
jgi:F-type H+-transporting ATPase subunit c